MITEQQERSRIRHPVRFASASAYQQTFNIRKLFVHQKLSLTSFTLDPDQQRHRITVVVPSNFVANTQQQLELADHEQTRFVRSVPKIISPLMIGIGLSVTAFIVLCTAIAIAGLFCFVPSRFERSREHLRFLPHHIRRTHRVILE